MIRFVEVERDTLEDAMDIRCCSDLVSHTTGCLRALFLFLRSQHLPDSKQYGPFPSARYLPGRIVFGGPLDYCWFRSLGECDNNVGEADGCLDRLKERKKRERETENRVDKQWDVKRRKIREL